MSDRKPISAGVIRMLYAESMGHCMNPGCKCELFGDETDIAEKAHINPYSDTQDNSFDNLILLCPSCHKRFDKQKEFTREEVKSWKRIREEENKRFFQKKFTSFDDLKKQILPILNENETIFNSYYIGNEKRLWDKFENKILVNNQKLKLLLSSNLDLFQDSPNMTYSNKNYIQCFLSHVDEFEATRDDEIKIRRILFPKEIYSIFGIHPMCDGIVPFTESLEMLIKKMTADGKYKDIKLGLEHPFLELNNNEIIYLDDAPKLRQLYHDYHCFSNSRVRLDSLNFALKYLNNNNISFEFAEKGNLRQILIGKTRIRFVYEYCLSRFDVEKMAPSVHETVVNLHNWNGKSCISDEAYECANSMGVTLLPMQEYYKYVHDLQKK